MINPTGDKLKSVSLQSCNGTYLLSVSYLCRPFRNTLISESSEGAYEIWEEKFIYGFVHRIKLIATLFLVCSLRFPVAFCKSFSFQVV